MTFPDPNLGRPIRRPGSDTDSVADVIPLTEPLKTEDRAEPIAERVYAPASERVPKDPVPGHREVIEHPDTHTPEREAAAATEHDEPSFTRVARPGYQAVSTTPGAGPGRQKMVFGIGVSWFTVLCCGVGVWAFMRWRAERNKPINRLRRQAQQAWRNAEEWRSRVQMPTTPEEATRPAAGLGTVVLPLLILMWRQSQMRSRQPVGRAARTMSEMDWQQRLTRLKERWNPARLELEKIQISRH